MKKTLNVLSIDFDFFQVVDIETLLSSYPDGHDVPTSLSNIIWSGYYANKGTRERLEKVKPYHERLEEIRFMVIENAGRKPPKAMVTNSHVHIYDFIMNEFESTPYQGLNIVNIDMHHDMFNDNEELDCGNWLNHISKAIPQTKITWIANPVSKEAYGMDSQRFEMVKTDFESIKEKTWDLIFLCRSDIWSPPHLDIYFDSLAKLIMKTSSECRYTSDIMCPRFDSEAFLQSIEAQEKIYKKVYEGRILARAGLLNERRRK